MENLLFAFDYDDRFFLMEPEDFAKTHQPAQVKWELLPQEN